MKRALAIPLLLILCATAQAQIEGPDSVGVYRLVRLRSTAVADGYAWSVAAQGGPVDIQAIGDGRESVFVGPPGEYVVSLLATTVDWDARQFTQKQSSKRVTITGDGPTPPGPEPTPPTPTPLPDGTYKLAQFVYDRVPQDGKSFAGALAGTFESVSAQMAAGTITSIADANAKIKNANADILGTSGKAKWQPWLDALNVKMTELWGQSANIKTFPCLSNYARGINNRRNGSSTGIISECR